MKQVLKRHRIFLALFTVFSVLMIVFGTTRIEYSFTAPGMNDDISMFIEIDEAYYQQGSFHTTSVIVFDKITLLQKFVGGFLNFVEIEEFPEYYDNIDLQDITTSGYLMKDDSLATSIVVGYQYAGYNVEYTSNYTVYLTYNFIDENTLEIGDQIISINNNTDIPNAFSATTCGESATFEVLRNDEMLTFTLEKKEMNGECLFGLQVMPYTEVSSTDILYHINDINAGGPSGGLMQSLFIYNQLIELDLTYGLKIAGTGTISLDGSVGKIGGIREKIITAISNDIDVFFVPYLSEASDDNYIVAQKVLSEFNSDMTLVGVSTFQEALQYLYEYGGYTYE